MSGVQLRAMFEGVVLAEYHCHYDWRNHHVTDIRAGVFHATRFASPQGRLIPLTPHDSVVVYGARFPRRQASRVPPAPQLLLFEVVPTG